MRNLSRGLLLAVSLSASAQPDPALVQAASSQLVAFTQVMSSSAVVAQIHQVRTNPTLPAATRSAILHQYLLALRDHPESTAATAAVQAIADSPAPWLQPHPENPAADFDPYGLHAAAAGTINGWQQQRWARRTAEDLARGQWTFLEALRFESPAAVAGAARAMAMGPAVDAKMLIELTQDDPPLLPLLAGAFQASGEFSLLEALARRGGAALAARAVLNLDRVQDRERARTIWGRLLEEPSLAPVAMVAIGRLGDQKAFHQLAGLLDDDQLGVGAAHALSAFRTDWARTELRKLSADRRPMVRRRAGQLLAELDAGLPR